MPHASRSAHLVLAGLALGGMGLGGCATGEDAVLADTRDGPSFISQTPGAGSGRDGLLAVSGNALLPGAQSLRLAAISPLVGAAQSGGLASDALTQRPLVGAASPLVTANLGGASLLNATVLPGGSGLTAGPVANVSIGAQGAAASVVGAPLVAITGGSANLLGGQVTAPIPVAPAVSAIGQGSANLTASVVNAVAMTGQAPPGLPGATTLNTLLHGLPTGGLLGP